MGTDKNTGNSNGPDKMSVKIYTRNKPIAPPRIHKMAASNRNSNRIVNFFAPIAFLRPITEVRSLTVTNIMLAIPNMPTIRLMPPIIDPTILMVMKD